MAPPGFAHLLLAVSGSSWLLLDQQETITTCIYTSPRKGSPSCSQKASLLNPYMKIRMYSLMMCQHDTPDLPPCTNLYFSCKTPEINNTSVTSSSSTSFRPSHLCSAPRFGPLLPKCSAKPPGQNRTSHALSLLMHQGPLVPPNALLSHATPAEEHMTP